MGCDNQELNQNSAIYLLTGAAGADLESTNGVQFLGPDASDGPDTTVSGSSEDTSGWMPALQVTLELTALDFQTKTPVEGATILSIDNDSGEVVFQSDITDSDGKASLTVTPVGGAVAFRVQAPDFWDTYTFNIPADAGSYELQVVSNMTATMAPALAGISVDEYAAVVAGRLRHGGSSGTLNESVGCATAEVGAGLGEVAYFGENGLPTTFDDLPMTHPANGMFLVANLPAGAHTVKGKVEGSTVMSADIFAYDASVTVVEIIHVGTSNPSGCM